MKFALLAVAVVVVLAEGLSPAASLALGLALGLCGQNPDPKATGRSAKLLLGITVVALGFGMDFRALLGAGVQGLVLSVTTIGATLLLGHLLSRWLKVDPTSGALISAGTAICGGSAIAAVAAVIGAGHAEITAAMGTVFVLNAVALYLFPPLGHALQLNAQEFGTWAGVAIHDISSVVGAASSYSQEALLVATAVKLSRALWIVPVALLFAHRWKSEGEGPGKFTVPWFIAGFILASACRTALPTLDTAAHEIYGLAKLAMSVTLCLIGSGISLASLRRVGPRPMLLGVVLWLAISMMSLAVIQMMG